MNGKKCRALFPLHPDMLSLTTELLADILDDLAGGHSSVGRASRWHREGQGFESPCLQLNCNQFVVNRPLPFEYEQLCSR